MQRLMWRAISEYSSNSKYVCYANIVCEIIYGRLYFLTAVNTPHSTQDTHFFTIDDELLYERYYEDFGPLHLGQLYRFCCKLNKKFKSASLKKKKIVFYTNGKNPEKRANAAFLIGAYQVIYLKKTPEEAYRDPPLTADGPMFKPFRDASCGESVYDLTVLDCLKGLDKAISCGFVDFSKFNVDEYEHHMRIDRGDLTWIVPSKILAFSCPQEESRATANGIRMYSPADYVPFFKRHRVTDVIRLNKAVYDKRRFTTAGIRHHDLYFPDGTTPSDSILRRFLQIVENMSGAAAVHCKAGLGRTGSLIGCYLMKHYRFTHQETIAWLRICRPGSVIGLQQTWLQEKQAWCWMQGDLFRRRRSNASSTTSTRHSRLVSAPEMDFLDDTDANGIDEWGVNGDLFDSRGDSEEDEIITQGDRLNRLKINRTMGGVNGMDFSDAHAVSSAVRRGSRGRSSSPPPSPAPGFVPSRGESRERSASRERTASRERSGSLVRSGSASSLRGSTNDLSTYPRRSSSTFNLSGGEEKSSPVAKRSSGRFVLATGPARSSAAPSFSSSMAHKPPVSPSGRSGSAAASPVRRSATAPVASSSKSRPSHFSFGVANGGGSPYVTLRDQPSLKSVLASRQAVNDAYVGRESRYSSSTFPRSKSAKIQRSPSRENLTNGSSSTLRSSRPRSAAFADGELAVRSRAARSEVMSGRSGLGSSSVSKSYSDLYHAYAASYDRSTPTQPRYSSKHANGYGYGAVRASYSFF